MTMRGSAAFTAALLGALLGGGCGDAPAPSAVPSSPPPSAASGRANDPGAANAASGPRCEAVDHDSNPDSEAGGGGTGFTGRGCFDEDPATVLVAGKLVDSEGSPAPNVGLRFWRHDGFRNTTTEGDGTFSLYLTPGKAYDVDAFLGGARWRMRRGRHVHVGNIRPDEEHVTLRLNEAPVVLESGVLVDKRGTPMAGWEFLANRVDDAGNESYIASVTTDAEGRYRVASWSGGRVRISVGRGPEGQTWRIARSNTDATTDGTRLEASSAIAGKVIVDDGGTPAGAIVRLWRNGGILDRCVTVDTSGAFEFDDTSPDGDYEIAAALSGYETNERHSCWYDALEVRLEMVGIGQRIEGRLLDTAGEPVASTWIRFVPADARPPVQSMTGIDGAFRTIEARDVDYEAFVLVTGEDGTFVRGPSLGRCRGGQTSLTLRVPR